MVTDNSLNTLLDAHTELTHRNATLTAALTQAVDLLVEWHDENIRPDDLRRLHAETRLWLLNVPVGGR